MRTLIALFRGINVGGNRILPMKELASLLEGLGAAEVRTYIQSGNAVLKSDRPVAELSREIETAIEERYGFRPRVLLLEVAELRDAMENNPFPEAVSEPKSLHLYFLSERPASPDLAGLEDLKKTNERFVLSGTVFYLHAPDGIGRSRLAEKAEALLGVSATARNWRTVTKVAAMAEALG